MTGHLFVGKLVYGYILELAEYQRAVVKAGVEHLYIKLREEIPAEKEEKHLVVAKEYVSNHFAKVLSGAKVNDNALLVGIELEHTFPLNTYDILDPTELCLEEIANLQERFRTGLVNFRAKYELPTMHSEPALYMTVINSL